MELSEPRGEAHGRQRKCIWSLLAGVWQLHCSHSGRGREVRLHRPSGHKRLLPMPGMRHYLWPGVRLREAAASQPLAEAVSQPSQAPQCEFCRYRAKATLHVEWNGGESEKHEVCGHHLNYAPDWLGLGRGQRRRIRRVRWVYYDEVGPGPVD